MPSMYVNTPKLEQSQKDDLVSKLFDAAAPVLKVPEIFTYVNEYETIYLNGKPSSDQKMLVINLEAGPMKAEKIEILAGALLEVVQSVLGADKKLTLVFHANDLDHIAINGKLISSNLKK